MLPELKKVSVNQLKKDKKYLVREKGRSEWHTGYFHELNGHLVFYPSFCYFHMDKCNFDMFYEFIKL